MFDSFDSDLLAAVRRERESGRLQAWSADKEIKDHLPELTSRGWTGRFVEHLRVMLRPGEHLRNVGFFEIATEQRTLSRAEVKACGRTTAETNDGNYSAQFMSDSAVERLKSDAAERARRANIPTWSSSRNLDLPAGGAR
jgi:hypothetical protein